MTATLFTALAMASLPAITAPVAGAEICGEIGGRHVAVADCGPGLVGIGVDAAVVGTDAAVAGAEVAGADDWVRYGFPAAYPFSVVPGFPGEAPCISPTGLPYYTPNSAPCY